MLARRVFSGAGVAVTAGTVLSAFGVVTPAVAEIDCSAGVTIDADETDLRNAIVNGEDIICINPGTINLGLTGDDGTAEAITVDSQDLTVYAAGVTFDGGLEASSAFAFTSASAHNLTIEGATFTDFDGIGDGVDPLITFISSGTVTILDSRFESNSNYAAVGALDPGDTYYGSIVVEDSTFQDNTFVYGAVWGYSDITVRTSSFLNNEGSQASAIEKWSDYTTYENSSLTVEGNYFADNSAGSESTIYVDGLDANITNNTFENNYSGSDWAGVDIAYDEDATGLMAFNTFAGSTSDYDRGVVSFGANSDVDVFANLFVPGEGIASSLDRDESAAVTDFGGNVSTRDDSDTLADESSQSDMTSDDIALESATDNGGPTWTMALGSGSVAQDAVTIAIADELTLEALDQRGEQRGEFADAGAWDDGAAAEPIDTELAATGADVTGVALAGAVLGATGAALVARRRLRR